MRSLRVHLNLTVPVLYGIVLFGSAKLAPRTVQIDSTRTLIIASALIWIVSLIFAAIGMGAILAGALSLNAAILVAGTMMMAMANLLAIIILSDDMDGFAIIGYWPKMIIAVCFAFINSITTYSNGDI